MCRRPQEDALGRSSALLPTSTPNIAKQSDVLCICCTTTVCHSANYRKSLWEMIYIFNISHISGLMQLFIQQTFTDHLLCVRHHSRHLIDIIYQNKQKMLFSWREDTEQPQQMGKFCSMLEMFNAIRIYQEWQVLVIGVPFHGVVWVSVFGMRSWQQRLAGDDRVRLWLSSQREGKHGWHKGRITRKPV